MILQEVFFKRYGAIRPNYLLKPRVFNIDRFEFPKNTIYNYIDEDGVRVGPDPRDYFFRDISKKIFVAHQLDLLSLQGNPIRKGIPLHPMMRKFHVENKRFRLAVNIESEPTDSNTLAIMNYCMIEKGYRYPRSIYASYYKWRNLQTTIWKTMDRLASTTNRDQFFIMRVPQVLPSLQRLKVASDRFNQTIMRQFNTKEALFFLEFWKWMGESSRKDSILANVKEENLSKIQLVVVDNNHWCLFNLGLLNSWRYVEGESDAKQKVKIAPFDMQKRFLRAMMFVSAGRSASIDEVEEEDERGYTEPAEGIDSDEEETVRATKDTEGSEDASSARTRSIQTDPRIARLVNKSDIDLVEVKDPDELSSGEVYQKYLANLDKDLAQLDVIDGPAQADDPEEDVIIDNEVAAKAKEEAKREKDKPKNVKRRLFSKDFDSEIATLVEPEGFTSHMPNEDVIQKALQTALNKRADAGLMDGAEYRRKLKLIDKYKTLPSPDPDKTLAEYIHYNPEELKISDEDEEVKISDVPVVIDKSMLKSTLKEYDKKYIENYLDKDIMNMALSTQKAGFITTDYDVERHEDITGKYEVHTMRVTPVSGKASTLRFKLPVVDSDGSYTTGGTRYHMRKQRVDASIRKISPTRVALTSYYGKTFIMRSEKRSVDYALWLHNKVSELSLEDNAKVRNIYPSNVFHYEFRAPRAYSQLSKYLKSFSYNGYELNFDSEDREVVFGEEALATLEKNGSVLVGIRADGAMLLMDKDSAVYAIEGREVTPLGSFEEFLGIDTTNAPVEYTEARIFGKNIPVGVILSYKLGLTQVIDLLKIEVRRVGAGQRQNLQKWEFPISFEDETLIFSRDDPVAAMIIAGFMPFAKTLKRYSVYAFDNPAVYLKLLEQFNMGSRYLKEIDLLDEMFVDPITEQILEYMHKPTSYRELIVEATRMLATDYHDNPLDLQDMRIRGYERFAGAVYTEIVNSVRDFRYSTNTSQKAIDLNPYAVWRRVTQDPASMPSDELNPIQNLKELEAVTYNGVGGRSSRAMVKASRAYHPNDLGVISEATVDSHEVAINTYLSANPKFTNVRGLTKKSTVEELDPSSLVSTSALVSVGGNQDSAQRLNMVSIQQSHTIACDEYKPSPVRTGYEYVMPKRVGKSFATTAEADGTVVSVEDLVVIIEDKNGNQYRHETGRIFSKSKNLTVPFNLASNVKVGDKVKAGDIITYNTSFFERDNFDPKAVIWKNNLLARVVLMESRQTHEDASSITQELARKLSTRITKVKDIIVNFNQEVRGLVKPGQEVDYDTVLCTIEDTLSSNVGLFDKASLNTLQNLSAQAPVANVSGVVEKIEVLYNGDIEDMSNTLADITNTSNKALRAEAKRLGKRAFTGQVDDSLRINNQPLDMDSLVIRVYLTGDVPAGVGDKGVFANQLKTIFSEVIEYDIRTETGKKIDAIFGAQSVFNRIVNSVFVIGTTNTLLDVIGKRAASLYESLK